MCVFNTPIRDNESHVRVTTYSAIGKQFAFNRSVLISKAQRAPTELKRNWHTYISLSLDIREIILIYKVHFRQLGEVRKFLAKIAINADNIVE